MAQTHYWSLGTDSKWRRRELSEEDKKLVKAGWKIGGSWEWPAEFFPDQKPTVHLVPPEKKT